MAHFILALLLLLLVFEQAQSRPQPLETLSPCFKVTLAHLKTQYVDLLHHWNLTSELESGYMLFLVSGADSDIQSLKLKVDKGVNFCTITLWHASGLRDSTTSQQLLKEIGLPFNVSTTGVPTESVRAFCIQDRQDNVSSINVVKQANCLPAMAFLGVVLHYSVVIVH